MANVQSILLKLIEQIEAAGFPVVAIVHDLAPTNLRVWKELGIDPFKTVSFKNPCADREVFVFTDAPHLIKLIRNNLIDSGFLLEDGSVITDESIREVVMKTKTEYGLAYKVTETHLNVRGQQRQKVKYAS